MDKGYQCRGEKYGISTFFFSCRFPEAVQNRFHHLLWRDDKHTKVSVLQGEPRKRRMQGKEGRGTSHCVCMRICVCTCVCMCECVQGRNEGEGGTEIERKKGRREYTWKEEKGRRHFFSIFLFAFFEIPYFFIKWSLYCLNNHLISRSLSCVSSIVCSLSFLVVEASFVFKPVHLNSECAFPFLCTSPPLGPLHTGKRHSLQKEKETERKRGRGAKRGRERNRWGRGWFVNDGSRLCKTWKSAQEIQEMHISL